MCVTFSRVLILLAHSKSAPQPEILEASIQRVVVGQDVTIHCFVKPEVDITFTVDWILPETANLTGRYSISKIIKHLNPSIGKLRSKKNIPSLSCHHYNAVNHTQKVIHNTTN